MNERIRGFVAAVLAFVIWGLLPFYWKRLSDIPALEIIAYRIFMTFIILSVYFVFRFREFAELLNKRIVLISCVKPFTFQQQKRNKLYMSQITKKAMCLCLVRRPKACPNGCLRKTLITA